MKYCKELDELRMFLKGIENNVKDEDILNIIYYHNLFINVPKDFMKMYDDLKNLINHYDQGRN